MNLTQAFFHITECNNPYTFKLKSFEYDIMYYIKQTGPNNVMALLPCAICSFVVFSLGSRYTSGKPPIFVHKREKTVASDLSVGSYVKLESLSDLKYESDGTLARLSSGRIKEIWMRAMLC